MSLNELVDLYNQKFNSNASRSTFATDPSHHTPQSTFTLNTNFESVSENNANVTFTQDPSSSFVFDLDSSRFHLNDRVLAGEIVRPPPHLPPRIERIKLADKIEFSSGDGDIDQYENNEEYSKKYPDIKHQLSIVTARQARLPPVNMNINMGEQMQRLIQQGKMKNFHGYVNYPYNYVESPWYYDQSDERLGAVNHNPPRAFLTGEDLQAGEQFSELQLPFGIPQQSISQDRYELIPMPKMVYENFVPLVATRRIVYRRPPRPSFASALPEVEEMTYKF